MATNVENADADFNLQLKNMAKKLPDYATLLGISPVQVDALLADSLAFDYALNNLIAMQTFAHSYASFKAGLRNKNVQNANGFPVFPLMETPPPIVIGNIELRFRTLMQLIIHSSNYTQAIGQNLGIVAPNSIFDPKLGKPQFTIELTAVGHPKLSYLRGNFEGVEIWKDTGNGFLKLERVTQPHYTDPTPLPEAGMAAVWKYKLVFLYKDIPVGSFSDEVSITVNG